MPVNFLIFLVNAFVALSASIRTRTLSSASQPGNPGMGLPRCRQSRRKPSSWFCNHKGVSCAGKSCVSHQAQRGHPGMCHQLGSPEIRRYPRGCQPGSAWPRRRGRCRSGPPPHPLHGDGFPRQASQPSPSPARAEVPTGAQGGGFTPCVCPPPTPGKGGWAQAARTPGLGAPAAGRGAQMRCGRRVTSH